MILVLFLWFDVRFWPYCQKYIFSDFDINNSNGYKQSWMIPLFIVFCVHGRWFWCYFSDLRSNFGRIAKSEFLEIFILNTSNMYNNKLYHFFMVLGVREYDSDVIFMI